MPNKLENLATLLECISKIVRLIFHDVPQFRGSEWGRMSYRHSVLDRYVRHGLRRSELKEDHKKGEILTSRLRLLGMQITETGVGHVHHRPMRKPKSRRFQKSYQRKCSHSGKTFVPLSSRTLRKTSATALVEGVMDDEAGGAIAAFRSLVQCDSADILDPY